MKEIEDKRITVITKTARVGFFGHYRRDLEQKNWHYYETELGNIYHFRKTEMVCVLEGVWDGVEWSTI